MRGNWGPLINGYIMAVSSNIYTYMYIYTQSVSVYSAYIYIYIHHYPSISLAVDAHWFALLFNGGIQQFWRHFGSKIPPNSPERRPTRSPREHKPKGSDVHPPGNFQYRFIGGTEVPYHFWSMFQGYVREYTMIYPQNMAENMAPPF